MHYRKNIVAGEQVVDYFFLMGPESVIPEAVLQDIVWCEKMGYIHEALFSCKKISCIDVSQKPPVGKFAYYAPKNLGPSGSGYDRRGHDQDASKLL